MLSKNNVFRDRFWLEICFEFIIIFPVAEIRREKGRKALVVNLITDFYLPTSLLAVVIPKKELCQFNFGCQNMLRHLQKWNKKKKQPRCTKLLFSKKIGHTRPPSHPAKILSPFLSTAPLQYAPKILFTRATIYCLINNKTKKALHNEVVILNYNQLAIA